MIGNLFRTRKCDGALTGRSMMKSAGSGSMNGFFFGLICTLVDSSDVLEDLEEVCSFWGVGFFASEGQNLNWNYRSVSNEIGRAICIVIFSFRAY
jgi:hypothetical protein